MNDSTKKIKNMEMYKKIEFLHYIEIRDKKR